MNKIDKIVIFVLISMWVLTSYLINKSHVFCGLDFALVFFLMMIPTALSYLVYEGVFRK